MKRIFLILSISVFTIQFANAQLQAGPKLGLSGYQLTSGGNDGFRLGMYAGGFLDYELNNAINLQADLGYSQKGSSEDARTVKLDYFQFSPIVKFFTKKDNENKGLYIFTGIGLNLLVNDEITINDEVVANDLGLKSFDLTLQLGLGYKLENNLSIDLRLLDGSLISASSEIDNLRNLGVSLTLGYGFDL